MASVVEELKGKLAELEALLEAIRAEALILEGQKSAFMTVIKVFDPSAKSEVRQQPKQRDRSTPGRRVTDLLRGRDVRRGVLELLRDAEEPILAGDLSKRFAEREGFGTEIAVIGPNLAGTAPCDGSLHQINRFFTQVRCGIVALERAPVLRRSDGRVEPGKSQGISQVSMLQSNPDVVTQCDR
ncbi:hypothetical protein ACCS60_16955 [Rhizobium acaciae]|uniref:hypothetical protein n=1 Tax=Rhizobium acaciae TaxID=2989736 RepID=UPI003F9D906A